MSSTTSDNKDNEVHPPAPETTQKDDDDDLLITSGGGQLVDDGEGRVHDDLIILQQNDIEREIQNKIPLIGVKESTTVLEQEYIDDKIYAAKARGLSDNYEALRRIRPDGNCFFRAFSYATLEGLIRGQIDKTTFRKSFDDSRLIMFDAGFTQFTVDDFYTSFQEVVEKVEAGMTETELETAFQDPSWADYLVVYLRILTSAQLKVSASFYSNFIEDRTLEEFCQLEVEPMNKESDHIHIIALTEALSLPVRVVYMDRGAGAKHDFPESAKPVIHLLYRPGHYDILYPKAEEPGPVVTTNNAETEADGTDGVSSTTD